MPWALELGGRQHRIDDLSPAELMHIARRYDLAWIDLILYPSKEPDAFWDVVEVCAKHLEQQAPERPTTARQLIEFLNSSLKQVDSDLPTMYENGLPLVEGDTETTLSSGAPEPSDGRPTSPEPSPTET